MEYEIGGEERLFDDSTNPSLIHGDRAASPPKRSVKPQGDPAQRRLQKAEVIPEEEHQLS